MTGERCPHCLGLVAPARRGGDQLQAWQVHLESCPSIRKVARS